MPMSKPVFKLKTASGHSAIRAVLNYRNLMYGMTSQILTQCTDKMVSIAQDGFNNAIYDGDNDVYVHSQVDKRATGLTDHVIYKVVAESVGGNALFIEFGSGKAFAQDNGFRKTAEPKVGEIGSYGKGHGASGNAWVYTSSKTPQNPTREYSVVLDRKGNQRQNAHWTKGNPPARAMFGARQFAVKYIGELFHKNFTPWVKKGR